MEYGRHEDLVVEVAVALHCHLQAGEGDLAHEVYLDVG
jgi:hypothetical protein